jgi:hypothetical protein
MNEEKEFIERIDQLIRLKATGSPHQFALRLDISERKLYRIIKNLKDLGCPIVYDNYIGSYKYEIEGSFKMKFIPKSDEDIDLKDIKGGFFQNIFSTDNIWQWEKLDLTSDNSKKYINNNF